MIDEHVSKSKLVCRALWVAAAGVWSVMWLIGGFAFFTGNEDLMEAATWFGATACLLGAGAVVCSARCMTIKVIELILGTTGFDQDKVEQHAALRAVANMDRVHRS